MSVLQQEQRQSPCLNVQQTERAASPSYPLRPPPEQKGQLGHGDLRQRNVPTKVAGLDGKFVIKGARAWGCCAGVEWFCSDDAAAADGEMVCPAGRTDRRPPHPRPTLTLYPPKPRAASGGKGHTVVVTKDGQSFAFGLNTQGQLGTGSIRRGKGSNEGERRLQANPFSFAAFLRVIRISTASHPALSHPSSPYPQTPHPPSRRRLPAGTRQVRRRGGHRRGVRRGLHPLDRRRGA
jgi:alpha-tubulin suppressor-like RCC1 family protein